MIEKVYAKDLSQHLNKEIISYFLVNKKELREGAKDFYIRLRLSDKSSSFNANIWKNAKNLAELFKEGDIVKVKGIVIKYKDQMQLTINGIKKASDTEYDLSDYIASTQRDVTELSDQLYKYIDDLKDDYLKELMLSIFDDKEFFNLFAKSPAAKTWHHNYVGGLLEHSVFVAKICDFSSHMYPVDRDLLICGALLHDIGKVYEYNMKSAIDFTVMGRLIGHICIGDQIVFEKASKINNFPKNTLIKLRHLILSHHGEFEKAAARLPQTIEAIVLHYADNLDAQTVGVKQLIESSNTTDAEWSEFDRLNNRYYFLG